MFTKEHLLPNQEMCLGIESTFETADSKRELKSEYLHIRGNFTIKQLSLVLRFYCVPTAKLRSLH